MSLIFALQKYRIIGYVTSTNIFLEITLLKLNLEKIILLMTLGIILLKLGKIARMKNIQ